MNDGRDRHLVISCPCAKVPYIAFGYQNGEWFPEQDSIDRRTVSSLLYSDALVIWTQLCLDIARSPFCALMRGVEGFQTLAPVGGTQQTYRRRFVTAVPGRPRQTIFFHVPKRDSKSRCYILFPFVTHCRLELRMLCMMNTTFMFDLRQSLLSPWFSRLSRFSHIVWAESRYI